MNLLYLIFGMKENYHYEAIFSILSFLAKNKNIENIFVYTDAPVFYKCLEGKIIIKEIDASTIKDWKGKYDYFFRTKIKAIENLHAQSPQKPLIYLDSDTFLYKDHLDFLFNSLMSNKAFMHKRESLLSDGKSSTERRMWKRFSNKSFSGISIQASHAMWNAGFIAIPVEKREEVIKLVLNICDDFCENISTAKFTSHTLEQFAFSVSMQEIYSSNLMPAEDFIGHYWSNKEEWDMLIKNYLSLSYVKMKSPGETITDLNKFDFNQAPIQKKPKNTRVKLDNLVKNAFPDKEIEYIK